MTGLAHWIGERGSLALSYVFTDSDGKSLQMLLAKVDRLCAGGCGNLHSRREVEEPMEEMKNWKESIGVAIDERLREKLDRLAKRAKVSRSEIVRSLLEGSLDKLDLADRVQDALAAALQRYGAEIEAWRGLHAGCVDAIGIAGGRLEELQQRRDELFSEQTESLRRGDPVEAIRLRQETERVEQEIQAMEQNLSHFEARLAGLEAQRSELLRKLSEAVAAELWRTSFLEAWQALQRQAVLLSAALNNVGEFLDRVLLLSELRDRGDARGLAFAVLLNLALPYLDDAWQTRLRDLAGFGDRQDFVDPKRFEDRLRRAFSLGSGTWPEVESILRGAKANGIALTHE